MLIKWFGFLVGITLSVLSYAEKNAAISNEVTYSSPSSAKSITLQEVKERGYIICGVSVGIKGFSSIGANSKWQGLDIDICRAVAAAVFPYQPKIKYIPIASDRYFSALNSGKVDLLGHSSAVNLKRDGSLQVDFPVATFYDGQGFLVHRRSRIRRLALLKRASVCVTRESEDAKRLQGYSRKHKMRYRIVSFENVFKTLSAYERGLCDAYTGDYSALSRIRITLKKPRDHVILPEVISLQPLSPAVRQGDSAWADVVRWSVYAMIKAEYLGITRSNISRMKKSTNPLIQAFFSTSARAEALGLDPHFAEKIISLVGNYKEVYQSNFGRFSKLNLKRGLNNLWNKEGLFYAPPFF